MTRTSFRAARQDVWTAPGRRPVDGLLVLSVLTLTMLGLLMVYSTTFAWSTSDSPSVVSALLNALAGERGESGSVFLRQALTTFLGLGVFVVAARMDYGLLRRYAVPIMALGIALLVAVLLFGEDYLGARRTFFYRSIQPSEAAKLCLAIYAAAWLASRREQVREIANGLVPFGVIVGSVAFLIIAQPDLSTAAVVLVMAFAMFFFAGATLKQMTLLGAIVAIAFWGLITLFPHATERLRQYILSWTDPSLQVANYHQFQMFVALGNGGLFGKGLGAGGQKFGLLPLPNHDSVTAVIGEELGLVGVLLTLVLFALFAWRGLVISKKADTAFGAFLAVGIVVWVVGQMLLHVLSVFALIPFGGMASPFLSQGGSSIIAVLAASGVLVSVGRGSRLVADADHSTPAGGVLARARVDFRRRNSRSRFARTYRFRGAEKDAPFGFRPVRRRTRGHGA